MVGSVVFLAALSLASGLLVAIPSGFVQKAIVAFAGGLR